MTRPPPTPLRRLAPALLLLAALLLAPAPAVAQSCAGGCNNPNTNGSCCGGSYGDVLLLGGVATWPGASGLSLGVGTLLGWGDGPGLLLEGALDVPLAGVVDPVASLTARVPVYWEGLDRPWTGVGRPPSLVWLAGARFGVATSSGGGGSELRFGPTVELFVGRLLWIGFRPTVALRVLPRSRTDPFPIGVSPSFDLVAGWLASSGL